MEFDKVLPFPRGSTLSDKSLVTVATSTPYTGEQLLGQTWAVPDTVHLKHPFVRLRAVLNHSGGTLTVARKCLAFTTGDGETGRYVTGITGGQGYLAKPYDDAYAVDFEIAANDVFYVVEEGPCDILVTSSTTDGPAMTIAQAVTSDANGVLDATTPVSTDYLLGYMDEEPAASTTAYRVYVKSGFNLGGS